MKDSLEKYISLNNSASFKYLYVNKCSTFIMCYTKLGVYRTNSFLDNQGQTNTGTHCCQIHRRIG